MPSHQQIIEKSRLGRLLVNRGYINEEQLKSALAESYASGLRIGEYLVKQGFISEKQLFDTLRRQKRLRFVLTLFTAIIVPFQPLVGCGFVEQSRAIQRIGCSGSISHNHYKPT